MEMIEFKIEIKRVLDVLSKEIYDSPYALLRENIQNAYDAILMRAQYMGTAWSPQANGIIKVLIDVDKIIISDNGIGMSGTVLEKNYWNAGSSGKRTELAMKSGVVGTFGIGAMANFGVCTKLKVETESIETKERIVSEVERNNLSLSERCISIDKISPTGEYGTTVTSMLDPQARLTFEKARNYLLPYVQYLPVRVELNGNVISQKVIEEEYSDNSASIQRIWNGFEYGEFKGDVLVQCNDNGRVSATIRNILIFGKAIRGVIYLRQDGGPLWGLRSSFGLAPIPINSIYDLGGVVNISIISPTAGREALSRQSVEVTLKLIQLAEECATNTLAESEICNKSTAFMYHVNKTGNIALASKLKVSVGSGQEMTLGEFKEFSQKRKCYYYEGNDDSIIKTYGNPDTPLIVLSRTNPRRQIEASYIRQFCKVEMVKDTPSILKVHAENSYSLEEISFVIKIKNILEEDYALPNVKIMLAEITHNLPYIVQSPNEGYVEIYLQRGHSTLQPVLKCYRDAFDVFPGVIKDYIRNYIYPRIQKWVPSSTREGADALQKILREKRELFEYGQEEIERDSIASLFSDLLAEKIDFKELYIRANTFVNTQIQEITQNNIGNLETEIPGLTENIIQQPMEEDLGQVLDSFTDQKVSDKTLQSISGQILTPLPPILRKEVDTNKKLLELEKQNPSLNNFQMFLGISDRAFREEYDFFSFPHTTRIIWGGHRIFYIFTHASGSFSLYYDIEMFEDSGDLAGGGIFPTTTIITKKRIFIPIPENLKRFFELIEGKKRKFYVRFITA